MSDANRIEGRLLIGAGDKLVANIGGSETFRELANLVSRFSRNIGPNSLGIVTGTPIVDVLVNTAIFSVTEMSVEPTLFSQNESVVIRPKAYYYWAQNGLRSSPDEIDDMLSRAVDDVLGSGTTVRRGKNNTVAAIVDRSTDMIVPDVRKRDYFIHTLVVACLLVN